MRGDQTPHRPAFIPNHQAFGHLSLPLNGLNAAPLMIRNHSFHAK